MPVEEIQPPVAFTRGQLGVGDLTLPAFASELLHCFDQQEDAPHTGLARRQAAPVGVGGKGAAHAQGAALDEGAALTFLAEAEAFEGEEDGEGEAVVDLDDVDVGGGDAGLAECLLGRPDAGRLGEVGPLAHGRVGDGFTRAEHPDGRVGAVPGAVLVGEEDGPAPVGPDAAVELGKRVGDHLRGLDVFDGDGVAVIRVGVEPGVVAGRDGDLGQLLDGGPELVHVTAGRHGVLSDEGVAEGGVELDGAPVAEEEVGGAELALEICPRRRAVREQDGVDLALGDGGHGVLEEHLPARSAHAGRVDVVDVIGHAEVFGQLDGGEGAGPVRHEAVDLVARDARVGEGPARGLVVQLEGGLVVHPAAVRQCRPHDRHPSRHEAPFSVWIGVVRAAGET